MRPHIDTGPDRSQIVPRFIPGQCRMGLGSTSLGPGSTGLASDQLGHLDSLKPLLPQARRCPPGSLTRGRTLRESA